MSPTQFSPKGGLASGSRAFLWAVPREGNYRSRKEDYNYQGAQDHQELNEEDNQHE
jgi:hypothetical protein